MKTNPFSITMRRKCWPSLYSVFFAAFLFCGMFNSVYSQEKESKWFVDNPEVVINWDTNYYESYLEDLTTRLYSSVKYTAFRIVNTKEKQNLFYQGNRNIILGFGVSYSWFTINIGLNFPFVNHDNDKYGKTTYLDLQTHMYLRQFNIDLYLQTYSGNYLSNSADVLKDWPNRDTFQTRRDINTFTLGYNFQYVFNWKRFSFKAIYNQNEWQKKSAGSLVGGATVFYVSNKGDSSLIPQNLKNPDLFYGNNYNEQSVLNIGLSAGYYYTLVIAKHFFISAGLAIGPSLGNSWINNDQEDDESWKNRVFNVNNKVMASLGYNSERLFIGFSFLQQMYFNQLSIQNGWNHFATGNVRAYLVYRFTLKNPIKIANPRYWKMFNK